MSRMSVLGGRRVAALCALLALGLTACGGSDKPNYSSNPPVPSTPVTSATPTDTITQNTPSGTPRSTSTTAGNLQPGEQAPSVPPDAALTPGSAISFATYWMRTLDWGYATGSSALARTAFASTCTDCTKFMSNYDDTTARHYSFHGGRFSVESSVIAPNDKRFNAQYAVDVTVSIGPLTIQDQNGKVVESDPAYPHDTYRTWLLFSDGKWTVVDWKELAQ